MAQASQSRFLGEDAGRRIMLAVKKQDGSPLKAAVGIEVAVGDRCIRSRPGARRVCPPRRRRIAAAGSRPNADRGALGDIGPPRPANEDGAPRAQGHRPGHRDPRSLETKGSKAVVLEFEEPVGILEWLASRCPLRVQRHHKFSVGRADGTPVRVRDGREAD